MQPKNAALTLSIPTPCNEDYQAMTSVKGGRFCGACEKTIVDFRKKSDRQILQFYQESEGKICGVFNREQLNRSMPFALTQPPSRNWKTLAALASGLFLGSGLLAQSPSVIPAEDSVTLMEQTTKRNTETQTPETQKDKPTILKGTVLESESNLPLAGATVYIKNTDFGTITDAEGNFELTIPADLLAFEVEIAYLGFESKTLLFNEQYPLPRKSISVELGFKHEAMIMGIVMATPTKSATCDLPIETESMENKVVVESNLTAKKVPIEQQILVSPNPFLTELEVTYKFGKKDNFLFLLYDRQGQLVFAQTVALPKGQQTIQLAVANQNLAEGIYILQISDSKNRILGSKKVFKGPA